MRITLKQSGGFAGIEQELARVDTARLDAAKAKDLEQSLLPLRRQQATNAVGADLLRYEVVVEDGERRDAFSWTDDGSDAVAPLRTLVTKLLQAAAA